MRRSSALFALVGALALALPVDAQVVISQFRTLGPGGASDEFIELHNTTGSPVEISGWRVMGSNNTAGGSTTPRATIDAGVTLPAHGFFLVANTAYAGPPAANQTYSTGITDTGGVAITDAAGTVIDQVGLHVGSAWKEGTVLKPLSSGTDQAYTRRRSCGGYVDTGDNAADFVLATANPRNLASVALPPPGLGATCDDGDACTGDGTCDATSTCVGAAPVDVDDDNACTTDACTNGTITHTARTGETCDDGNACTSGETCTAEATCGGGETKSCSTPPSVCHQAAGTCDTATGDCSYAFADAGASCNDTNACTENDVCDGAGACAGQTKVCTPPSATCVDGTTSRVFSGGSCEADGSCAFTQTDTTCDSLCVTATGLCGTDLCAAVTCDEPPSQCHLSTGICDEGTCSYDVKPSGAACDDGDPCTLNDGCAGGASCAGTPVTCATPPAASCSDANTLKTWSPTGTCNALGTCDYTSFEQACAFGCDAVNAVCKTDPCLGKVCNTPPGQCYSAAGSCNALGQCEYAPKSQGAACDDADECSSPDTCDGAGVCVGVQLTGDDPDGDDNVNACDDDDDGDGIPDEEDNCPVAANADQKDTDADGQGDVCDSTPNGGTTPVPNQPPEDEGCGCGSTPLAGLLAFGALLARRRRR